MKIALLTTGGDAPGMNPAIRAVVRRAASLGHGVLGVESGFHGLAAGRFREMDAPAVSGIVKSGGTVLGTARCPEFHEEAYRRRCYRRLAERDLAALVVIGGNGSRGACLEIARESGLAVAFIPASIDNDVPGTEETIGFDTAVNTALEAIDRIRDTATSHQRVFLVEVMGRENGFIALAAGLADGAEVILTPEAPLSVAEVVAILAAGVRRGKKSMIVVVAEGAVPLAELAAGIGRGYPGQVRCSTLGYIQRGGVPTARSRYLAHLFGAAAVEALDAGRRAVAVGLDGGRVSLGDLLGPPPPPRCLDHRLLDLAHQLGGAVGARPDRRRSGKSGPARGD